MKTTLKIAALCAVMAPAVAYADGTEVTDGQLQAFRSAITTAGCTIDDESTADMVQQATGYDENTLKAIVEQLRVYNEIVDASTQGGITLVSGDCAS